MFFIAASDLHTDSIIGSKARRLMELREAGYPVPDFMVVPHETLVQITGTGTALVNLCTQITAVLPASLYAVRSAALVEDTKVSSMAGQFSTKLAVSRTDLPEAVWQILEDARSTVLVGLEFSVIIQVFIESDYAGVCFTRDPQGGRETVLEYRAGRGDAVVGGAAVQQVRLLPEEVSLHEASLPFVRQLMTIGRELESRYDWPQDIEWAVQGGVLYILQTRPITSIAAAQWEGLRYLDRFCSDKKDFIFAQTAVSETFYQPKPLAFSMLQRLYEADGPIAAAYKKIGVKYTSTDQFQLLGNDLFVDREAEIQTLYPSYSYVIQRSSRPRRVTWTGHLQTVMNQFALARVSISDAPTVEEQLCALLAEPVPIDSVATRFNFFMEKYPLIFSVNLKAEKALQQYTVVTGDATKSFMQPSLLSDRAVVQTLLEKAGLHEGALVGNTISIDDRSPLRSQIFTQADPVLAELPPLPTIKRLAFEKSLQTVNAYVALRELARLCGVRLMANVRQAVTELALEQQFTVPDLVYFATLEEIMCETFSVETLEARRMAYEENKKLRFPIQVASFSSNEVGRTCGIAPGLAEGELVTIENLETKVKPILLTDMLSPELVTHFPKIAGIVARQGGLLSHLAIMAREAGLPVIVTNQSVQPGDVIRLDASKGTITTISSKT